MPLVKTRLTQLTKREQSPEQLTYGPLQAITNRVEGFRGTGSSPIAIQTGREKVTHFIGLFFDTLKISTGYCIPIARFPTFAGMNVLFLLFAFLIGIAITVQAGVNANLRQALSSPVLAAVVSFGSGLVALILMLVASGGSVPTVDIIRQVSWWKWLGGVMGAVYMITVIVSVQKIGTANLVSLSVAGQLTAAIVLDHYGLLNFAVHPANGWRLLGVGLIVAGVLLVVKN